MGSWKRLHLSLPSIGVRGAAIRAGNTPPVPYDQACITQTVFNPAGHGGIDVASNGAVRVDLKSVYDGEVVDSCSGAADFDESTCGINGNYLRIKYPAQNGGSAFLQYGHLTSLAVKKGDKVANGQVVGKMGQSGLARGIHTHFHVLNANFQALNEDFRVVYGLNGYPMCSGWGRR